MEVPKKLGRREKWLIFGFVVSFLALTSSMIILIAGESHLDQAKKAIDDNEHDTVYLCKVMSHFITREELGPADEMFFVTWNVTIFNYYKNYSDTEPPINTATIKSSTDYPLNSTLQAADQYPVSSLHECWCYKSDNTNCRWEEPNLKRILMITIPLSICFFLGIFIYILFLLYFIKTIMCDTPPSREYMGYELDTTTQPDMDPTQDLLILKPNRNRRPQGVLLFKNDFEDPNED